MKKFKLQNRAFQKSFSVTFFITLSSFHRHVTYDIIKIVKYNVDEQIFDNQINKIISVNDFIKNSLPEIKFDVLNIKTLYFDVWLIFY